MTTDIDAVIHASSAIKDTINFVGDKYELPNGWLNTDFMKTSSYSPKLDEFSVYYKSFYGVLSVRTISNEYLIAMKLRSGRKYKNDLSDIIGILSEHEESGKPLTLNAINTAVINLYGGWDGFPEDSKKFIEDAFANGRFSEIYASVRNEEKDSKAILVKFEEKYPKTATGSNVDDILKTLKAKRQDSYRK